MSRAKILITGATGFLGRHFLFDLFRADPELEALVVVRARDHAHASLRIAEGLARAAGSRHDLPPLRAVERVHTIVSDILEPLCGLDEGTIDRLREDGIEEVWHLAATTDFELAEAEIDRTNVDAAASALELAHRLGARRFVHTSTAYSCGRLTGTIEETLHPTDGPFTNAYERSKCVSEHRIASLATKLGLAFTILRPSIVVGPSQTFVADGARHGMYGFLRAVYAARQALRLVDKPLRLVGDPHIPLNIIPVDQATALMVALRAEGFRGGPIHHLTSDVCPTLAESLAIMCDAARVPRFELTPSAIALPTPFEAALAQQTRVYAGYLQGEKRFVRRSGLPIAISSVDVLRFCSSWVQERRARMAPSSAGTSDVSA